MAKPKILQQIDSLNAVAAFTAQSNITVYVATTGNDSTGTGRSAAPYRTIQKAFDTIPKNLNGHTATVNIASGTYNESVTISDFTGVITLATTSAVTINSLSINNAKVNHTTGQLTVTPSTGYAISLANGSILTSNQNIVTSGGYSGFDITSGSLYSNSSVTSISNASTGIAVGSGSKAYMLQVTGSGVSTGMAAVGGGIIAFTTSNLSGTSLYFTANGGKIYTGAQIALLQY